MIRETTNPKYFQAPQVPGIRKIITRGGDDGSWAFGAPVSSVHEPEHEPELCLPVRKSSIFIMDESHDAPLWLVLDRVTGVTFARVRGSLPWVVSQIKLLAGQLGGQESDLYFQKGEA